VGIHIDGDNRSLIVAGDQEQIYNTFLRLERLVAKSVDKKIFENIPKDSLL